MSQPEHPSRLASEATTQTLLNRLIRIAQWLPINKTITVSLTKLLTKLTSSLLVITSPGSDPVRIQVHPVAVQLISCLPPLMRRLDRQLIFTEAWKKRIGLESLSILAHHKGELHSSQLQRMPTSRRWATTPMTRLSSN